MGDQDRLTEALAEYLTRFGQRRWHTDERYWEQAKIAFVHARKRARSGDEHEVMVMSRIIKGQIRMRWYVLPDNEEEWLSCDRDSFEGFLAEGIPGLQQGHFKVKQTACSCGRKIHRSETRADRFAQELAQRYGKSGVQRSRRCNKNPRSFHLTAYQKGSNELIPDAYIDFESDGAQ